MKIITWNCNMAFRKKAEFILAHKPDILVVPECEHPDKIIFKTGLPKPTQILWYGNNRNKGLGIFSYNNYELNILDTYKPSLKTIIPISVKGKDIEFTLFAIWAFNPTDKDGVYVEQIWKAIHHYDKFLSDENIILTGDFNSNTIWDRKYREGNHSAVVKKLEEKKIYSCYHLHHRQLQGKELHPTLYMYRHKDKPYHIDYCFVSERLMKKVKSVEIGTYKNWTPYSDHVPVIVTFKRSRKVKGDQIP